MPDHQCYRTLDRGISTFDADPDVTPRWEKIHRSIRERHTFLCRTRGGAWIYYEYTGKDIPYHQVTLDFAATFLYKNSLPPPQVLIDDIQRQRAARRGPPSVRLGGPADPPIVRGKELRPLTLQQYIVVKVLYDVWPRRLKTSAFKAATREFDGAPNDPVATFKHLAQSHELWTSVIFLPGEKGSHKGYGLLS